MPEPAQRTAITWWAEAGYDERDVMLWVGHEDPALTLRLYRQARNRPRDPRVAEAMAEVSARKRRAAAHLRVPGAGVSYSYFSNVSSPAAMWSQQPLALSREAGAPGWRGAPAADEERVPAVGVSLLGGGVALADEDEDGSRPAPAHRIRMPALAR